MLEGLNSAVLVFAALCVFAIAYRFYGLFISTKVLRVNSSRRLPSDSMADGLDYHKTNRYVLFGHHFAAIAGAGPLTGPALAAQFGFLPGALWILIGAVPGGAVHDVVVLFASVRHRGESLANIARNEIGRTAGRFLLQEMTGKVFPRFNDHNWLPGMIITGLAFTFMWGYLLYTGSISTIWPLFGISNQLLAACALIIVSTMLVRLGRKRYIWITLVPGILMAIITLWAGYINITVNYLPQKLYLLAFLCGLIMLLIVIIIVSAGIKIKKLLYIKDTVTDNWGDHVLIKVGDENPH